MPQFSYTAKTKDSHTVKEVVVAPSREELVARLRARNLFVVSISEIKEKTKSSSAFSFSSRTKGKRSNIKLYDLTFFARNLSTTLYSGVTLLRSLEILSSQTESFKFEKILQDISKNVKEGLSLSEAVAKYPVVFSTLWRGIVEVGEASGNLPFVLEKLASYLELRMEFERKIKSALVYPSILIVASTIALMVFFLIILPKFAELFKSFGADLPLFTRMLFSGTEFVLKNIVVLCITTVILIVVAINYIKRPATRRSWDKLKLQLPLVGSLFFLACIERLTSTIYILLDSGLPVVYTLEVAARSVGNTLIEENILQIKDRVREGASLSKELSNMQIFPLLISEMAKIGEETGTMPKVFHKIATHYQTDMSTRVDRLVSAFEPIMIIVMGVVIGGLVIALFLPLFRIASIAKGMS
jgi:type IV pilus assembly protein PilC